MIKSLTLKNVGPLPNATIKFGKRLNILTGDNGLGKSFLLDIMWYMLTGYWPIEVNGRMMSGYIARPMNPAEESGMSYTLLTNEGKTFNIKENYNRQFDFWIGPTSHIHELNLKESKVTLLTHNESLPRSQNLVVYAHYDGSYSIFDPYRNLSLNKAEHVGAERQHAYVLTASDVWDGLDVFHQNTGRETPICNGLIRDWVSWQDRNSYEFSILSKILELLSPPEFEEKLSPAEHKRIATNDSREHPFIKMPYGEVPAIWASASIRRILTLAYILTWTITEHKKTCDISGQKPISQMTFLFDEVDAHLHPKWQRQIMSGLMEVLEHFPMIRDNHDADQKQFWESLANNVQIVSVTHSPLVMSSLEEIFDKTCDKWLDLDMEDGVIKITERDFERMGDAEGWLTSEAFDLKSSYSIEAEHAISEASELIREDKALDSKAIGVAYQRLLRTLNPKDSFLLRFRYICSKKGVDLR